MEIYAAVDDYCVLKLTLTSSFAEVPVHVRKDVDHVTLKSIHPRAKSLLLKNGSEYVTQHIPMMRLITADGVNKQLLGVNEIDTAQVDEWLEYSWQELGKVCPFQIELFH